MKRRTDTHSEHSEHRKVKESAWQENKAKCMMAISFCAAMLDGHWSFPVIHRRRRRLYLGYYGRQPMLMLIILFHNIAPLLSPLLLTISLNERKREETCWIIAWINIRLALHSQLRRTDCSSSSSSSESSIDYGLRQLAANKVKRKSLPMYMQHNNCPDYRIEKYNYYLLKREGK